LIQAIDAAGQLAVAAYPDAYDMDAHDDHRLTRRGKPKPARRQQATDVNDDFAVMPVELVTSSAEVCRSRPRRDRLGCGPGIRNDPALDPWWHPTGRAKGEQRLAESISMTEIFWEPRGLTNSRGGWFAKTPRSSLYHRWAGITGSLQSLKTSVRTLGRVPGRATKREPILNTFPPNLINAKVNGRKTRNRVVHYSGSPAVGDLGSVFRRYLRARGSGHYGAALDGWDSH
jgi:hypothetical protein